MVLLIVAAVMHGWAVNHADLTLLSVNAAISIIANAVISSKYLGEKFDWKYDFQGLFLIAVGSTMIVMLSSKEKQTWDMEKLFNKLTRLESGLFGVFVLAVYLGSLFLSHVLPPKLRQFEKDCESIDKSEFSDDKDDAANMRVKQFLPPKAPGDKSERPLG